MISPHYNTTFQGSVSLIQTKEIATQGMYIAANCCSLTDAVRVLFSVRQSPSQQASHLQNNQISDFPNMQSHFKIRQIHKQL